MKPSANLLATAPELLKALKSTTRLLAEMHSFTEDGERFEDREQYSSVWEVIDEAREAIEKATGE